MQHESFKDILNKERIRFSRARKRFQVLFTTHRTSCRHLKKTEKLALNCDYYATKGIECGLINCPYLPKQL